MHIWLSVTAESHHLLPANKQTKWQTNAKKLRVITAMVKQTAMHAVNARVTQKCRSHAQFSSSLGLEVARHRNLGQIPYPAYRGRLPGRVCWSTETWWCWSERKDQRLGSPSSITSRSIRCTLNTSSCYSRLSSASPIHINAINNNKLTNNKEQRRREERKRKSKRMCNVMKCNVM